MKRVKAEYLQKILDQVHIQNAEYYENLASEYTIRLEQMELQINTDNKEKITEICEDQDQEQLSYILKKPEILRMHLEILYKTVNLVSEEKIQQGLAAFKEKKERLRLEEQQRQMDTKSKKKQRNVKNLGEKKESSAIKASISENVS